jgi:hypothetical protein
MNRKVVIAVVAILAMIGVYFAFFHHGTPPPAPVVARAVPTPAPKPTGPSPEDLKLATVKKGEGIEHAIIRQLVARSAKFGFDGDGHDARAIKLWAGHEAHVLAIRAGYADWKFGGEVRVARPDEMAYLLKKDSNDRLSIAEYRATPSGNANVSSSLLSPVSPDAGGTKVLASSVSQSQFLGMPDFITAHPLPNWEYQYIPG